MNRYERARLTMAKCSISEGEEQIAHLSELIKVLELRALLTEFSPVLLKRVGEYFDVDTGSSGKVQI